MRVLISLTAPADQIGGWAADGVGQGYGSGYPIDVTYDWVRQAIAQNVR